MLVSRPHAVASVAVAGSDVSVEVLVYAPDLEAAKEAVTSAGGRLVHVLTSNLLVIALSEEVSADSVKAVSTRLPDTLEGRERVVADAWLSRFGAVSDPIGRFAEVAAATPRSWGAAGLSSGLDLVRDPKDEVPFTAAPLPRVRFAPTSSYLEGSVAVGVVMVSGPPEPPFWVPVTGSLKYVSVSEDKTVWGVNAQDEIYRWHSGVWEPIPGSLKQVSVGHGDVWGVNVEDEIYYWNGDRYYSWTPVQGALKHVSVGEDGSVWGVNADDEIFRYDQSRMPSPWEPIPGALKQISVANADTVWGVNSDDEIYHLRPDWESRTPNVSPWGGVRGELKHVSAAADGSVWGVNAEDEIYFQPLNYFRWRRVPGSLKQISVGAAALVWGANRNDRVYRRKGRKAFPRRRWRS
jgi:virginiamycin B lyase